MKKITEDVPQIRNINVDKFVKNQFFFHKRYIHVI